jgi:hypothetical protein
MDLLKRYVRYVIPCAGLALIVGACANDESQERRGFPEMRGAKADQYGVDTSLSCESHCNGYAFGELGYCACDSSCGYYGDCCHDKLSVCPSKRCVQLSEAQCMAREDCEHKSLPGWPGPRDICVAREREETPCSAQGGLCIGGFGFDAPCPAGTSEDAALACGDEYMKCCAQSPECVELDEAACVAREDCEYTTIQGWPGPRSVCTSTEEAESPCFGAGGVCVGGPEFEAGCPLGMKEDGSLACTEAFMTCCLELVPCGQLGEAECTAREDCEYKTIQGWPGPRTVCTSRL